MEMALQRIKEKYKIFVYTNVLEGTDPQFHL